MLAAAMSLPAGYAVLAALAAIGATAIVLRRRPPAPAPQISITPIASEAGAAVRVELTNRGRRSIHAPMVILRPAPPGVRRRAVTAVVPPAVDRTPLPVRSLAPGASGHVDLPCPLQPGEVYTRVLGLATDAPEEAVYGLPIETLLAIEVEWRANRLPWTRRCRALLVRGDRAAADAPAPATSERDPGGPAGPG